MTTKDIDEMDFPELCREYRKWKIEERKARGMLSRLGKRIKQIANDQDLKGDMHGIKIIQRFTFAKKENLELAEEKGIPVPTETKTVVDMKALKETFDDLKVEGFYSVNYAISLSTQE